MINRAKKNFVLLFGSILFISIVGCDQIQSIFSGKKEKASAPAPIVDASAPLPANVLAQVGNWTLTIDEFKEKLANLKQALPEYDINDPASKKLIITELVNQQLLVNEAEQSGVASKKEINDAVNEFKRSLLVREIALGLTKGIAVTDQEAQDFYNQNKDKLNTPTQYHLREIVVEAEEAAKGIWDELLKGSDFVQMAKTRSKSASAANGGDIGFVTTLNSPQLEGAVSSLDIGKVSGVFKGPGGFYIVKLEEKKGGELADFATIKNDITAYITQLKQQQAIINHIKQLKQKTAVKVNESLMK